MKNVVHTVVFTLTTASTAAMLPLTMFGYASGGDPVDENVAHATQALTHPACAAALSFVDEARGYQEQADFSAWNDDTIHTTHNTSTTSDDNSPYSHDDYIYTHQALNAVNSCYSAAVAANGDCALAAAAVSSCQSAQSAILTGSDKAVTSRLQDMDVHYNYDAKESEDFAIWAYDALYDAQTQYDACIQGCVLPCPADPSGTAATVTGPTNVRVTWVDNSANEDGFNVQVSVNSGSWSTLPDHGPSPTTYGSYVPDNTYRFRVQAYTSSCTSGFSPIVTVPKAPANLSGTHTTGSNFVLTWTDRSGNETGFVIQKKVTGGTFGDHKQVGANDTSEPVTLTSGTTNYYRVRAVNGNGSSWYTNQVSYVY